MAEDSGSRCPICGGALSPEGAAWRLDDLLALWPSVRFTDETRRELGPGEAETRLHACRDCGLGIYLPSLIGTPGFYSDLQKSDAGSYYVPDKWEFAEALRDVAPGAVVAEIGCGPGYFLDRAARTASKTAGTEYNEPAVQAARARGHLLFRSDAELGEALGPVDALFAFHVLEHVADPAAFLSGMAALVRPGGRIGLSVPDMDGPVRFIEPCASNMPPHHATRWRKRALVALAARAGLAVERVASEPLSAKSGYYYSNYGVRHHFGRHPLLLRAALRVAPFLFGLLFRCASLAGRDTIGALRGQSIYILMKRPAG